jgi:hypothetical protein
MCVCVDLSSCYFLFSAKVSVILLSNRQYCHKEVREKESCEFHKMRACLLTANSLPVLNNTVSGWMLSL